MLLLISTRSAAPPRISSLLMTVAALSRQWIYISQWLKLCARCLSSGRPARSSSAPSLGTPGPLHRCLSVGFRVSATCLCGMVRGGGALVAIEGGGRLLGSKRLWDYGSKQLQTTNLGFFNAPSLFLKFGTISISLQFDLKKSRKYQNAHLNPVIKLISIPDMYNVLSPSLPLLGIHTSVITT